MVLKRTAWRLGRCSTSVAVQHQLTAEVVEAGLLAAVVIAVILELAAVVEAALELRKSVCS